MWALINETRFGVDRTWVRDRDGRHHWVVAVKATYTIGVSGALRLADEQPAPQLEPEYFGTPGESAVRLDVDLVMPKQTTDVILNASAYAPGGKPTPAVECSLSLSGVRKAIVVHGPRVYVASSSGVTPSSSRPFVRQPIVYEWAYGGADLGDPDPQRRRIELRNPVGRGVAANPSSLIDRPAHCIEYPEGGRAPAGFGAIASHWSPRRELAGTFDAHWQRTRHPLLPLDHDPAARQSAPADQRPGSHLVGGEALVLRNMTPDGLLGLILPRVELTYATHIGASRRLHRGVIGTVVVEPERGLLCLVWQTSVPVKPRDLDYLDATVVSEVRT